MKLTRKALIIGGGIGGLAAATALRQVGITACVFEQASKVREIGAGLSLWPNATKVLTLLGMNQALEKISSSIDLLECKNWRGDRLAALDIKEISRKLGSPSYCVLRAEFLDLLANYLDKEIITLSANCLSFSQDDFQVTASFADGRKARGDFLIAADGLHSQVREQLLGPSRPRYAGYTCWRGIASLQIDDFPPGLSSETAGSGQRFGMVNLPDNRLYWYATKNAPEYATDAKAGRKHEVAELFKGWHYPIEVVIEATNESDILRHDIYDRKPAKKWGEGRVTLLGDAAHPTTPNHGQGACQAIEDALVLSKCLSNNTDDIAALRLYEAKRLKRTAQVTLLSQRIGSIGQWEGILACAVRDMLIKFTMNSVTKREFEKLWTFIF